MRQLGEIDIFGRVNYNLSSLVSHVGDQKVWIKKLGIFGSKLKAILFSQTIDFYPLLLNYSNL